MNAVRGFAAREIAAPPPGRPFRRQLVRLRKNVGASLGVLLLLFIVALAAVGPPLAPYSPIHQALREAFTPPSPAHPFGTDQVGRDVLSRVVFGARISLEVAVLVLALALVTGGLLGAVAGYYGGLVDEGISRAADVFFAFPQFLLAMAIVAALGPSLNHAMLSVAISYWPRYARLMRASVLAAKNAPYVEAARVIGAGDWRVITKCLMPNALAPMFVQGTMDAGIAILTTASLSFVGLGAAPPTPEWGGMVAEGRGLLTTAWWVPFFPGLFIAVTVAGFMFLGDGLRDLLDPTLRGRIGF